VGAGYTKGVAAQLSRSFKAENGFDWKDAVELTAPWVFIGAYGRGFSEVPAAVQKDFTFEELLQESNNPNSFLYRHAMPIGLGLSIVLDPTTYLTFGATTASKTAATKALTMSFASSWDEALEASATGVLRATGEPVAKGLDIEDIFILAHQAAGRPFTLGDAMGDLKLADQAQRGIGPRLFGVGPRRGTLRSTFARGGQGIRFAGVEIPGTVGLGSKISKGVRPDRTSTRAFEAAVKVSEPSDLDVKRLQNMFDTDNPMSIGALPEGMGLEEVMQEIRRGILAKNTPFRGTNEAVSKSVTEADDFGELMDEAMAMAGRTDDMDPDYDLVNKFTDMVVEREPQTMRDLLKMAMSVVNQGPLRTPGLGEKAAPVAGTVGKYTPAFMTPEKLRSSFSAVIPREKLMRIADDARRSMALSEFRRITIESTNLAEQVVEESQQIFKLPQPASTVGMTPTEFKQLPWAKRAETAIRNIFDDRPEYVPLPNRRNLLKPDVKLGDNPYKLRLGKMRKQALDTKQRYIQEAEAMGFDEHQLKSIEELWVRLVDQFDDPVEVLARFTGTVAAKLHTYNALDSILNNPMFARIGVKHLDDVDGAFDEFNKAHDALFEAKKKFNEKGLSKHQKAARKGVVMRKETAMATAKQQWVHAKAAAAEATEGVGSRLVRDPEAWGRSIGENVMPVPWRKNKYYVPEPIYTALQEMRNPRFIDTELSKVYRNLNFFQNKWKMLATTVNPSFHVMNFVGGMWNNLLGGVYNPNDYVKSLQDIYRARLSQTTSATEKSVMSRLMSPVGGQEAFLAPERVGPAVERLQAFEARRAGGGLVREELYQQASKQAVLRGSKSKGRRALTAARRGYVGAAAAALIAPDEWVPDDVEAILNPLLGAALGLPELSRAGRYLANDVEETLRITPLRIAERDQSYKQLLEAYSVSLPTQFGKFMGAEGLNLAKAQQEAAWDIGAAMAIKYQFDYSDLTWAERYVAKTIFPFYTFYKNNFVLQVREVVNRPRFINTFTDLTTYLESLNDDEDNPWFKELLPEYFDKLSMFEMPVPGFMRERLGLPQDQPIYLNPKLPFSSLNLLPPLWTVFNEDSITPTPQRWMQAFSPIFGAIGPFAGGGPWKPMLEYTVGYQLGLARPIDFQRMQSNGWRNSHVDAPGYASWIPGPIRDRMGIFKDPVTGKLMMNASMRYITDQMASPFFSQYGDVVGGTTEEQRADAVSWLTGIRLTPVDPVRIQRGWLYRMENYLEGQRSEARARGGELSIDDQRFLARIRANLKVVEADWDRRQAELYGGG